VESLEEGGYLAVCDIIQGCHAEGDTISEALENIEDVARIILELQREENLPIDAMFEGADRNTVLEAEVIAGPPS
jgi:predicted RNase H-like HicB family nuclease